MSSHLIEQHAAHYRNEKYPGLPGLDYFRRYLDGLVSILEGYLVTFSTILITVGISFSMFDFLSGGTALNNPVVFNIWALIQTIAIDAQFVNMFYRLKVAWKTGKKIQAFFYLLLGLILAFVTFGAAVIPALQKSLNLTFDGAIYAAGLSPVILIWARSFVAILLAIIGAFSRTVIVFDQSGIIKNLEEKTVEIVEENALVFPSKNEEKIEEKRAGFSLKNWLVSGWKNRKKATQELEEKQEENAPVSQPEIPEKTGVTTDDLTPGFPSKKVTQELAETIEFLQQNTEPVLRSFPGKNERKKPHIGLSLEEVLALESVKKKGIKKRQLLAAITAGQLKQKSDGSLAKTAVETWIKTRAITREEIEA